MKIITITPAERDLARLGVELAERMGKGPDPRMVVLANAEFAPRETSPVTPKFVGDPAAEVAPGSGRG